jgi:hypothetical protein
MNLLKPSVHRSQSHLTTKLSGSGYKYLDAQHAPLAKVFKRNFIVTVLLFLLLLLTGCGGQKRTSTPSFNLKLASETLNLKQGETKTLEVSLEKLNGFNSSVALTISELPVGLSASFDPDSTPNVATLSISASASAEVKETSLTLTGTAGSLVKTATLKLVVSAKEQNPNAPRISNIPSVTVVQNSLASAATPVSTFTITTDKAINTLTVTASSSNQSLIPNSSLNPTCTAEGACTMTYPVPRGQALNTDITVKVADAANQFNETSFNVAVGPRLVKTTADSGADSLRQHVLESEAGDFIGFDSPKTITLSTGQIKLDKALSIDGTGKAVTIDANKTSRHFEIAPGTEASISSLTLINGSPNPSEKCTGVTTPCGGSIFIQATASLNLNEVKILSNEAFLGGGINTNGTLTMLGGVLAKNGAGIGGAIRGSGATIDLTNTVIGGATPEDANTASFVGGGGLGGGIAINDTTLTLTNVTIQNNTTTGEGGGILEKFSTVAGKTLSISNSLIANNTATLDGGGIYNEAGNLTISASRLLNNESQGFSASEPHGGGAIFNKADLTIQEGSSLSNNKAIAGGAIANVGKLTLSASLLSENNAGNQGSAIGIFGGEVTISNSTIAKNQGLAAIDQPSPIVSAPTITINNSTIADNEGRLDTGGIVVVSSDSNVSIYSSIFSNNTPTNGRLSPSVIFTNKGFNLETGTEMGFTLASDKQSTDPLLGPLQDNGGGSFTMALQEGSPAIDKGDCQEVSLEFDQRGSGFARLVDDPDVPEFSDGCDMGAFEKQ